MNAAGDPQLQQFIEIQRHNQKFKDQVDALTDKCWELCVDKPSTKLSGSNEKCITNCVNRFIDTSNYVIQHFDETISAAASSSLSEELVQ